ncbi:ABC transporter ATP-binding protein [Desulfosarcina alkanivorans]|uniref:ABC transporter ATP-binding protein n=1 Tax=Desulfosarcina alkanivorans TaxID=571177 RepID=A0A5K7YXM3_9BACT|nr:ABC transporter ATP-binding protein [Desulfosarcina alkanivorans]BBO71044.1 ABC transporter ATP-binding protein [Desulfosarcina alkanivorans]
MGDQLLEIDRLRTVFASVDGVATAVDGVSFTMEKGETLGIVGESGSGKSVTALSVMRLIRPPGKITGGAIRFGGSDLLRLPEKEMQDIRGNRISMIFQEPMTSLNPLYTVGDQIAEMFIRHRGMNRSESRKRSVDMLDRVRIPSPAKRAGEYPHQLSGGMRQRVMIAMALACNPELLIADEPTTALDVTIQAQVIDLMLRLKEKVKAGILMITHDLGVVAEMAQRVVVMYAGQVVETGDVFSIFEAPSHPYTRALLRSMPKLGARAVKGRHRLREITGMVPSLYDLPAGCCFAPRCPDVMAICRQAPVPLVQLGGPDSGRRVRCRLWQKE